MRRLAIGAFAASLLVALVGTGSAYANHNQVEASLTTLKDGAELSTTSTVASCTTATCRVELPVRNRELGRFRRWTDGNNAIIYLFSPFNSFHSTLIEGTARLDLLLEVRLLNDGVEAPHGSDVTVTVVIVPDD
jgi:hypothetical protein